MAKKNGGQPPASQKPDRAGPAHEVRIGRLRATIWQNHHETQGAWYSITLTRSYKDGQGQWQSHEPELTMKLLTARQAAGMAGVTEQPPVRLVRERARTRPQPVESTRSGAFARKDPP